MLAEFLRGTLAATSTWGAVPQAMTFALATLIQEDVPTLAAAALAAAGQLPWLVAYLGCFFGIWAGDALLYGVARILGRPVLEGRWARRFIAPETVARSEAWFARSGSWLLVTSRFVPGTRLPTYLAAGFLKLPLPRFLCVTGVMVALWTAALFGVGHLLGEQFGSWVGLGRGGLLPTLLAGTALVGLWRWARARVPSGLGRRLTAWAKRWRQWEFWPSWIFYTPVAFHYLRLSVRHGGLTVPSSANPGIETGGLIGESKFATLRVLQEVAPEFTAESWRLAPGNVAGRRVWLRAILGANGLDFPLILKPDLGQRGLGVKLIRHPEDAERYLTRTEAALVVQRYVAGPGEAGIFYFRHPDESRGHIFGITEKVFPTVVGDGHRTLEELIWSDARASLVAERYLARLEGRRQEVLPNGQSLRLVEAGNHAQGCIFRDGSRWLTRELEARIDAISRSIPGFYIGRYDVRFASELELRQGQGFRILELNGAAAEATQVYDARNSLRTAYRTLFRQWDLVFAIGAANRARGVRPETWRELWRAWRVAHQQFASYPLAD